MKLLVPSSLPSSLRKALKIFVKSLRLFNTHTKIYTYLRFMAIGKRYGIDEHEDLSVLSDVIALHSNVKSKI